MDNGIGNRGLSSTFKLLGMAVSALVIFRIFSLTILYLATGGNEIASDIKYISMFVDNPFGFFHGTTAKNISSYAPLEGLIYSPLVHTFKPIFGTFLSYRFISILCEAIGVYFLLKVILGQRISSDKPGLLVLKILSLIVAPYMIMVATVTGQDEIIGFMFMCIAVAAIHDSNKPLALISLTCGVLFSKIFFIVPLFYVLFFWNFRIRDVLLTLPILLVYFLTFYAAYKNDGHAPFVGFSPSASHSVLFWILLIKNNFLGGVDTVKNIGLMFSLVSQLILIVLFWRKRIWINERVENRVVLLAFPLLLFLMFFYQHNPEYLILSLPPLLYLVKKPIHLVYVVFTFSFAWIPKVVTIVANTIGEHGRLSSIRMQLVNDFFHLSKFQVMGIDLALEHVHFFTVIVYSLLYIFLIVIFCQKLFANSVAKKLAKKEKSELHISKL